MRSIKLRILSLFLFRNVIPITSSRRENKIDISPSDVGLAHYTVIDNLKHSFEKNLPKHHDDFLNALIEEMHGSLCDKGDHKCEVTIYKQTLKARSFIEDLSTHYHLDESEAIHDILPPDFDSEVKQHILNSVARLSLMEKGEDIVYVMNALDAELEKLKNSESVQNDDHRQIGMMAIHVGMESAKQWMEVASDPEHIFYRVPYGKLHGFSSSSEVNDTNYRKRRLYDWSRGRDDDWRDDDDFTKREREREEESEDSEDESESADTNVVQQQQPQGFSFFSFIVTVVIRDIIGVVGGAASEALTGAPDQALIGGAIAAIISSFIGFFVALGDTRARVCIGPFTAGCVDDKPLIDDDDDRETDSSESESESEDRSDDHMREDDGSSSLAFFGDDDWAGYVVDNTFFPY